jgi:transposase
MLKMDQYELIRTAHRVYGKSGRAIARDTGHSRNTIKKALAGQSWGYRPRRHQPYPILGPYLEIIDGWLLGDREAPKKQRHTAHRVYARLVEEYGFTGSESTVRHYVQHAKVRLGITAQAVFIPLEPAVGREAEVDWGNATACLDGERVTVKFFCLRSKYSGKHFVRCYPCERQQAFFDAHLHAFEFFGGIFPVLIYDNLTSAVRKVLQGKNREEQEAFLAFRSYHSFEARFCNPGQGHEKGGVEGGIGYVRRNYLVPVPEAPTLHVLNEALLRRCLSYGRHRLSGREQTVNELFEQERSQLLAVPRVRFTTGRTLSCKVNKYAMVRVDRNHYSVPTQYVGLTLQVLLDVDRLRICYRQQEVASHDRVYGCDKWQLQPDHYLEVLRQRPQAFESARPIKQWRATWPSCFEHLLEHLCERQGRNQGIKEFLSVLLLHREYSGDEIEAAVELALEAGVSSGEGVKHVLCHTGPETTIAPLDQWASFPPPDVSVYTQLYTAPETELGAQAKLEPGSETTASETGLSVQADAGAGSELGGQSPVAQAPGGEPR